MHFLNLFPMVFIPAPGVRILADHPRMRHTLTLLGYDMNGAPVSVLHGAPLRLRCENELGFRMVKWISAIEFVEDFADLGAGQGGYNEDHEFYGYRMPI
jgi:sulfoxide reductase catalytic subunit YedY